ncbi:acyltransferase family protein [Mucilaginibacter antarcticus]|uniref:Acyltransferase family protein n=1 Tax=Mucilaginibacter antarcticus TaxID=1855725 RepID=A0ABW5XLD1_9SPHI
MAATIPADDLQQTPTRLHSLDALRGFDMVWIMGLEPIVIELAKLTHWRVFETMAVQLVHPDWNGFHFYDLIFPLFLFMAGVSVPFSVGRELEKGTSRNKLLWRVVRRGLILVIFGIVYNNGLNIKPIEEIRFGSVLGRIGLAYMCAAIIYLYAKEKWQIFWFWFFIVAYWLILEFASAPGFAAGDLTMEGNFASYFDRCFLPGKLYLGIHDPEGLFSTIPAISSGLLGILTGITLKKTGLTQMKKVAYMSIIGVVFLLLAQLWNLDFPINKNLWSSSFVLNVGGYSLLLMSLFYYVIDVLGHKKWAFFFKIIGMNSILIYMSKKFIDWPYTNEAFFNWLFQLVGDPYNLVIAALTYLMIKWLFLYLMYQKKIFLRV